MIETTKRESGFLRVQTADNKRDKDARRGNGNEELHGAQIQYPNKGSAPRLCPARRYLTFALVLIRKESFRRRKGWD